MDQVNVSIIMPAYNCERTAREAIASVLSQTVLDWELIIIDDYSSDKTMSIVREESQKDKRIHVLRNKVNSGVAVTRNRGLDLAIGQYISFIDSDDLWEPDKLEKQIKCIEGSGADLCYASYDYINLDGSLTGSRYQAPTTTTYEDMLCENSVGLSTVLVNRESLGSLRFESQWFHEDYVLWLRLLRSGKLFCGLSDFLVHNRIGGRSSNKLQAAKYRWKIYRHSERIPFPKALRYFSRYIMNGMRKYGPAARKEEKR